MPPSALLAVLLAAPGPPHPQAVRTPTPPVNDGRPDDQVWRAAAVVRAFTQKVPDDGAPPSEPTEMRLLYDDRAIYVGFDCEQVTTPIVPQLRRRDGPAETDWVC